MLQEWPHIRPCGGHTLNPRHTLWMPLHCNNGQRFMAICLHKWSIIGIRKRNQSASKLLDCLMMQTVYRKATPEKLVNQQPGFRSDRVN